MGFQYPFRVGPLTEDVWQQILAGADTEFQKTVTALGEQYDGAFELPSENMRATLGPVIDSLAAYLEDRDRALEDYLSTLSAGAPPVFDFPGPVVVSVTDLFSFTSARTFTTAYMTAVSSGTATVAIYKNGVQVGSSLSMPAATTATSVPLAMAVKAGDYGQARVTAVGGGLQGLAVALG